MFKPKITNESVFVTKKKPTAQHIFKIKQQLDTQAQITDRKEYIYFLPFISSLSQTFWKKFCWSTSLISVDCSLWSFLRSLCIHSLQASKTFFLQKGWVVPSVQPWSTHTHTHSHSPAPTPETPNSTVSPSTTRWPQPDAHFNQLLHQRYNPHWNLIPLFFWSLRTRRSEDGWWQGGSYGQRPLRPIWDSAPTVYRIERTEP